MPRGPEYELQQKIAGGTKDSTNLADMFGWQHFHVIALRTKFGMRTGIIGTLGKGWPDLTMMRDRGIERRIVLAELKSDVNYLTPDQKAVHAFLQPFVGRYARARFSEFEPLRAIGFDDADGRIETLSIELYVWRPRDLDVIAATLR